MWEEINEQLITEYELERSPGPLRSKESSLQHDRQCYLAARNTFYQNVLVGIMEKG